MWLKEDGQETTNVSNSYFELFLNYVVIGLMKDFIRIIQMSSATWMCYQILHNIQLLVQKVQVFLVLCFTSQSSSSVSYIHVAMALDAVQGGE